jgi:hypothetical protein
MMFRKCSEERWIKVITGMFYFIYLHKTTATNHCGISEDGLTSLYLGGVIELNVEQIQFL